jgi:hypothetical protein
MSGLERRLDKLEVRYLETCAERHMEKGGRLPADVHDAPRSNERRQREGLEPLFVITDEGEMYTRDGRPVTEYHQTLAEEFYWLTVEWGGLGFVHDAEAEAFYTAEGELAVSRTRANLQHALRR